ncbi:SPOR domain-containing protein [Flavobacterium sp. RSSA_27]|uniref:HU domain-containing protein n=1 Tax=Flavobacterium sp. RSSA_27 TaxID=3447667 RepID=UPI003F3CDD56
MKIEQYISQLLYRYQCVAVPGFGAFLTETQSAQLQESTTSFFPPKKMISFNANLKNNDGLLANHIALAEKTSYDYAVSAIQFEVFNWKKRLETQGVLSFKNIGTFRLNADANLVFTAEDSNNYLTSSFGLSPFVSPKVKRELFEKAVEAKTLVVEPVIQHSLTLASEEEEEATRSHRYPFLRYAAIFVLGLGITSSVGYSIYQKQIENETLLVETSVQKKVQNKIQEATFFIESPIPTVTLAVNTATKKEVSSLKYHIMAGAYRSEENANKELRTLKKLGYEAKRIPENKSGLFPVIYGSFATFAEAQKAQKQIIEEHNPDAWILIQSL